MIYSNDIYRVCGICRYYSGGVCKKRRRARAVSDTDEACGKFVYDIIKKPVKRRRALKTSYSPDDFRL